MRVYFKKMKVKRGKMLRRLGTGSILIILAILIIPFFKAEKISTQAGSHQPAMIKLPPNPHIMKMIADYEDEIYALMDRSGTPGAAIAIVKDSTIVYLKGFGVKSSDSRDTINAHTVFR